MGKSDPSESSSDAIDRLALLLERSLASQIDGVAVREQLLNMGHQVTTMLDRQRELLRIVRDGNGKPSLLERQQLCEFETSEAKQAAKNVQAELAALKADIKEKEKARKADATQGTNLTWVIIGVLASNVVSIAGILVAVFK